MSGASQESTPTTDQTAVEETPPLPFATLDGPDFALIRSGPRISSLHNYPKTYYGPVTIRNYITGYTKKALRLSRSKDALDYPQVFLRLPVELQLHVLEHLHPMDLSHFSQASKSFRKLILDPKSAGVWKTSFDRNPQLPRPPSGVSEANWAFMLYGPGICRVCGRYGALTDFGLLKRFCEPCMKLNYSFINTFKDYHGNAVSIDHEIWTLMPRSYRYNGLRYTAAYATLANAKFLRKDFPAMWKKLTLMQILTNHGVPQIPELFEDYKARLSEHVQELHDCATKANNWAMDVYRQCSNEYDAIYGQLTEKCKIRLKNLGHEMVDIEAVAYSIQIAFRQECIFRLNSRTFRKLRPRLETVLRTRRETRIRDARQLLLEGIYKDYLKTRPPDEWQYLPQPRYIKEIDVFKNFLMSPCDERGDIAPGYAASFFREFIEQWTRKQQEETTDIFPKFDEAEETFETKIRRLELATSVVTCTDCKYKGYSGRVLLGWKSICRHRRSIVGGYIEPCATYEVNDNAVAAAASLVSCVGLDPSTATIDDMNARDDRFMCGNCMPVDYRGVRGLKVYTWIECIQHIMEMIILNDPMHNTPIWHLLTPEATRFVREHESPYPHPMHDIWRCNHCAHHFTLQVRQADAIEHVKKVHCIQEPLVGPDVAVDLRCNIRSRRYFCLGRDPPFEHCCKLCPELRIYKLWERDSLMKHIKEKHHVDSPLLDRDFTAINIITLTAADNIQQTTTP